MYEEIQKEIRNLLTDGSKNLIRFSGKVILFVMMSWILIGGFLLGVVMPVSIFKSVNSKDFYVADNKEIMKSEDSKTVYNRPGIKKLSYERPVVVQRKEPFRVSMRKQDLRSEIRETRGLVVEMRRFGSGVANLVGI